MANQFFKNFPEMQYKLDSGKIITIKDFFRKSSIEPAAQEAIVDYTFYELQEGDRPDVVATKLYGDADLHWVFFLVNDFDNYYDWYKSSKDFEQYMDKKYRGKYFIASDSTDIIDSSNKFLLGETVTGTNSRGVVIGVEPTYKRIHVDVEVGFENPIVVTGSNSGNSFTPSSIVDPRDGVAYYYSGEERSNFWTNGFDTKSNWEHEFELNESKRKIKIIRPSLIGRILSQFEKVMKS